MRLDSLKTVAAAAFLGMSLQATAQPAPGSLTKPAGMTKQWASEAKHNPLQWHRSLLNRDNAPQRVVDKGEKQIGPVHSFGTLYAPNGAEWVYTATFDMDDNGMYTAAHLTIYDENNNVKGTIDDTFVLEEHDTGVNSVQINPNVTQKFFNVNDKYELIIFIHSTTDDYKGRFFQHIFSLEPGQTEPLMTIPGNQVLMTDLATDEWSEKKQMVMMREEVDDDYHVTFYYDVYDRASWGSTNAPVLLHTFSLTQEQIGGSGEAAYSITQQNIGGKAYYALSYYDKQFFDPDIPWNEEPVVQPDNTFIIDVYSTDDFEKPWKTIRIPMETEEGFIYTFPCIGGLLGNDDFSLGVFGDSKTPYFIVTHENYLPESDDYVFSFHVYDIDGNLVKTLATDVSDYLRMADIDGQGIQFCLIDGAAEAFKFVDLPSGNVAAEIPFVYGERLLSTTLDRIPANGSYNYVISCSNGDADEEENVLHPIAYFDADGTLNHWDMVKLGKDIVMAQPAIITSWLNPYLFDTDPDMDYMFLVKLNTPSGKTEERFWVLNAEGEKHADFAPSDELGGALNTISVLNAESQAPTLSVIYYNWQTSSYVLNFKQLPLESIKGSGTAADPYLIATVGDLMQISKAPKAYYKVANDIDGKYYPIAGNTVEFEGTLDGDNHTISNLNIAGSGLVSELVGHGQVKNLTLASPMMTPHGTFAGFIASSAVYDGESVPSISNVNITNPTVSGEGFHDTFGTIIGELSTGATVQSCCVTGADINLPKATVGGIVGSVAPTNGIVNAVFFGGKLTANVAGGIAGEASNIDLKNAHVDADVTGEAAAGGIIALVGEYGNNRGTFANCYVEGTVGTTNDRDASVGGIAGVVESGENVCISKNIVALTAINYNENVKTKSAHRIAGHTCADEPGEILWEDPWWDSFEGDPYAHQDLWPRAEVAPDKGFASNYAMAGLAPVNGNSTMAGDATSVEGKTIAAVNVTEQFLATNGFALGSSLDAPWTMKDGKLALWFEADIIATGISPIASADTQNTLKLQAGALTSGGRIDVYTLQGVKVATADTTFSLGQLTPGIYVAKSNGRAVKFTVR